MRKRLLLLILSAFVAAPAVAAETLPLSIKPDPSYLGYPIGLTPPVFSLSLLTLTANFDPPTACPGQSTTLRLWVQSSPLFFPLSSSPYLNTLSLTATAPGMAPLSWSYTDVLPGLDGGLTVTALVTRPPGAGPWTLDATAVLHLGGVTVVTCGLCGPALFDVSATASASLDGDCSQATLIDPIGVYPNPFQDQVQLAFRLSQDAQVTARAFNVAGEPVQALDLQGHAGKNVLRWDGRNGGGGSCASGVYLVHVAAKAGPLSGSYWAQVVIAR